MIHGIEEIIEQLERSMDLNLDPARCLLDRLSTATDWYTQRSEAR